MQILRILQTTELSRVFQVTLPRARNQLIVTLGQVRNFQESTLGLLQLSPQALRPEWPRLHACLRRHLAPHGVSHQRRSVNRDQTLCNSKRLQAVEITNTRPSQAKPRLARRRTESAENFMHASREHFRRDQSHDDWVALAQQP